MCSHLYCWQVAHILTKHTHTHAHSYCIHVSTHMQTLTHTKKGTHMHQAHECTYLLHTHVHTCTSTLLHTHTHTHTYHIGPFMAGLITWPVQELVVLGDFQVVLNFHPFHQEDHPPGFLLFLRIRFIVQAKLSTHKHTALPTHVQTKIANTQEDLLSNTHITSILFLLLMSTEYWKKKKSLYTSSIQWSLSPCNV